MKELEEFSLTRNTNTRNYRRPITKENASFYSLLHVVFFFSNNEHPCHPFSHCSYVSQLWLKVFGTFGWSVALPNDIFSILALVFVGHSFQFNIILFWFLGCERNSRFCRDVFSTLNSFLDLILFHSYYFCKHKRPFNDYIFSSLISNWWENYL